MGQRKSKNLGLIQEKIRQEWGLATSKDTIKRILKCLGMKWKRIRTVVSGKPDPEIYERKKQIISALKKLSDSGAIDLRYLDESGFCLTPYVPYAWQDTEVLEGWTSKKSKRINVLGLFNRNNELYSYVFETRTNSEIQ